MRARMETDHGVEVHGETVTKELTHGEGNAAMEAHETCLPRSMPKSHWTYGQYRSTYDDHSEGIVKSTISYL